jgi:hypothetical protein
MLSIASSALLPALRMAQSAKPSITPIIAETAQMAMISKVVTVASSNIMLGLLWVKTAVPIKALQITIHQESFFKLLL